MQIFAQSLDGVRPRDWDASAIERLAKIDDREPLLRAAGLMYLLARAMDCQDKAGIALYRGLLEDRVDGYPAGFTQAVHVELAVCAWLAGDTGVVERHLKSSKGGIVEKTRRLLVETAFATLQGRDEDSERDRLRAISLLAKSSDIGQSKLTKDQLAMLQVAR